METDRVRVEIYRSFMQEGRAPSTEQLAETLRLPPEEIRGSLRSLADANVIELKPGSELIWLAHPFCASEASFEVTNRDHRWNAICIWDALGILAITASDGTVVTQCPDCSEELTLEVSDGQLGAPAGAVVHYGVPASRWYEDIVFT
jgi:hypothetical protein